MKTNSVKWFFVGAITVTAGLSVLAAVNIPNSFTAGQPIKAADINANFTSLKTFVDTLEGTLTTHDHSGQEWTSPAGIVLKATTGTGLAALYGNNTGNTSGSGVEGHANGLLAAGVYGVNPNGPGAWGTSTNQAGVYGASSSGYGGSFNSVSGTALLAESGNTAVVATTSGSGVPAMIINQKGNGNILLGRNAANAEVFRVTNNGSVQVQGVTLTSDRNAKQNFSSVDNLSILEKVVGLPISSWNYKTDADVLRHIGPMAQDFHTAFNLNGSDDKHISVVDESGVALAAIQGLNQKLEAQNAALKTQLAALEMRLTALERK